MFLAVDVELSSQVTAESVGLLWNKERLRCGVLLLDADVRFLSELVEEEATTAALEQPWGGATADDSVPETEENECDGSEPEGLELEGVPESQGWNISSLSEPYRTGGFGIHIGSFGLFSLKSWGAVTDRFTFWTTARPRRRLGRFFSSPAKKTNHVYPK